MSFRDRPCDRTPGRIKRRRHSIGFPVPSLPRHPPPSAAIRLPRLEAAAATAAKGGGHRARSHLGRTDRNSSDADVRSFTGWWRRPIGQPWLAESPASDGGRRKPISTIETLILHTSRVAYNTLSNNKLFATLTETAGTKAERMQGTFALLQQADFRD